MLKRKKGTINNIVYDNTYYHNGKYCFYPCIPKLVRILEKICEANETTEYIRIIPFYRNYKYDGMFELDEYMFFIGCKKNVTKEEQENFPIENIWIENPTEEHVSMQKKLVHLCEEGDIETFKRKIQEYIKYLDELIPSLMGIVLERYDLTIEESGFGYFYFEINSE